MQVPWRELCETAICETSGFQHRTCLWNQTTHATAAHPHTSLKSRLFCFPTCQWGPYPWEILYIALPLPASSSAASPASARSQWALPDTLNASARFRPCTKPVGRVGATWPGPYTEDLCWDLEGHRWTWTANYNVREIAIQQVRIYHSLPEPSRMSKCMSAYMSGRTPDNISEHMPDSMPDRLPSRMW